MKRGDVYLVSLEPVLGSEQGKTRPCVIISTDIVNKYAKTVTVAPCTSMKRLKPFPFHIDWNQGSIKLEQLRTVDKSRLIKQIDIISPSTLKEITNALKNYFEIE